MIAGANGNKHFFQYTGCSSQKVQLEISLSLQPFDFEDPKVYQSMANFYKFYCAGESTNQSAVFQR